MRDTNDRELVRRARRGSRTAASELFERHWQRAWRLALAITENRADADDAAQEAFERAFRGIATFDGRSSFATWLHRIVVNQALNTRRRANRRAEQPHADARGFGSADERFDEVSEALGTLSEERRLVVVLRYWLDLTPREIGELARRRDRPRPFAPGARAARLAERTGGRECARILRSDCSRPGRTPGARRSRRRRSRVSARSRLFRLALAGRGSSLRPS